MINSQGTCFVIMGNRAVIWLHTAGETNSAWASILELL